MPNWRSRSRGQAGSPPGSLARRSTAPWNSYLFAHTNPVFTIADGEPIRSREDAAFFVRWIDQTLGELRAMDRWDDPAHKAEVLATFEEGRRLYQAQVDGMGGSRMDGREGGRR